MNAKDIRRTFLDFFKSKGHEIVPSAPMVVKNDPTLMFTNSGMAPFKDWFLGNAPIKWPRVADTQKCLRVSGKHNDLEEVGVDTYHHTMFEMLGNWSFGDYFKKEAIAWSWELLTEVYKLPKDRLYATVFEGSADDNLPFDQEAYDLWKQFLPESHILRGNKKDNFWEMGDQGPCGPCSEIHFDSRSDEERAKEDGAKWVNADHPQVIEIWNNVFMEFNRKADGSLEKLPAQHVDTGMGFERLVRVLQGKQSNYDTDVFQPIIQKISSSTGVAYGNNEKTDIAIRVLSDHIRAISFAIADGQLPSNTGAGYVIRRILRRAVRYYYSFLATKEPLLCRLVDTLAAEMGEFFPELRTQQTLITSVIEEEEKAFLRTLAAGITRFEDYASKNKGKIIDGFFAFELYDTFGFPIDLTQLLAREQNCSVDMEGFSKYLSEQKERSRAATAIDTDDWIELIKEATTTFVGYEQMQSESKIVRYRRVKQKGKEFYQIVLDVTPFYAESGGQVGDTGYLETANERIRITDTKKENGVIVHFAERLPEQPDRVFTALVDASKRKQTANNHSATHLLHAALRQVLGTHVEQKGSLVNEEYLRFDFSHFSKVTEEELSRIEQIVNEKIRENIPADIREMALEDARKRGAMALFGEKYGDVVRVVTFDDNYSIELCGGTHVNSTGQIGLFKIASEGAVAAGIRRIEAISAIKAEAFFQDQLRLVKEIKELLKNPKDVLKSIQTLQEERSILEKELEKLMREKARVIKSDLMQKIQSVNGINFIGEKIDLNSADAIKDMAFEMRQQVENLVMVLGAEIGGKASLTLIISDELVAAKKLNAGNIIRDLAKEIQGGGGGQPFFATSGGNNPAGITNALTKASALVASLS
jgi:alanyl-tRNA synthetase